jgi:pimeloyl-ACP methyl ester carboxylesterase
MMQEVRIKTAGVTLAALEQGEGPLVLMIHGHPGLGWSWRHQLPALAAAGYRAVAVDSLGYGGSDRPAEAEAYTSERMQAIFTGVLDHYGAERAAIVGQDFGAQYAWNMAVRSTERVRGLATTIPYDYDLAGRAMLGSAPRLPAGAPPEPIGAGPDHLPSERFAAMASEHFVHFHYFQQIGPAERELADKVAHYLQRSFYALSAAGDLWAWKALPSEGSGYLDALPPAPPLPWPWMSEAEFQRFVDGYSQAEPMLRFIGGLNSYRTADANWEIGLPWADADVTVPTLFIYGEKDPSFGFFPDWEPRLRQRVPGLVDLVKVKDAGHLVQQEQPEVFNAHLLNFLAGLPE